MQLLQYILISVIVLYCPNSNCYTIRTSDDDYCGAHRNVDYVNATNCYDEQYMVQNRQCLCSVKCACPQNETAEAQFQIPMSDSDDEPTTPVITGKELWSCCDEATSAQSHNDEELQRRRCKRSLLTNIHVHEMINDALSAAATTDQYITPVQTQDMANQNDDETTYFRKLHKINYKHALFTN